MYVKIHVPYRYVSNALLIPETSIGTNQTGRFVYILGTDNRVELKPVTVGVLEPDRDARNCQRYTSRRPLYCGCPYERTPRHADQT